MSKARKILRILPDKWYLQIQYYYRLKKFINFSNPQTFNEKLQWLKIYDRKPEYSDLVDKYAVKGIMEDLIGKEYIIPTIGVWKNVNEIKYDELPDKFVLKANHDSGSVVICRGKATFDKKKAEKKLTEKMANNFYWYGREWPYKNVKPCVFAEQYMEDSSNEKEGSPIGLVDYKFFCFNGEPKFVYVSKGLENHKTAQISFYDLNGKEMPFHRSDFRQLGREYCFPDNFIEMCDVARKIAVYTRSPFARVDLYSINKHVYFSEITFQPGSGLLPFEPQEWDYKIGQMINIDEIKA